MTDINQEKKSRGLTFAEQQLLRHGWEEGKGLGRQENGISEAIKVKVKSDKGGVGHKPGEEFTFHWWDHVFNKAASSLQVDADQSGVLVKKMANEEEDGVISNRRPSKAAQTKAKLYGCFVKAATLLSGQEQPEPRSSSSGDSSSSSSDDEDKLDLSSTTKLSDADLMKACGGRTAHKGARHGLTMNAKLARLEQQEAEFMAKYGKKNQSRNTASPIQSSSQSPEKGGMKEMEPQDINSKKVKESKSSADCHNAVSLENGKISSKNLEMDCNPKKKKKREKLNPAREEMKIRINTEEILCPVLNCQADDFLSIKRKHKKKKRSKEENDGANEKSLPGLEEKSTGAHGEAVQEQQTDEDLNVKKKKKKKKKSGKSCEEPALLEEIQQSSNGKSNSSEPVQDPLPKKKRSEAGSVENCQHEGTVGVDERGKRKKCKDNVEPVEGSVAPKKKKKSKEKTRE